MTEVLAGAVGGLLALAGGFAVQALGARERRRERARALAAAYLADMQNTLIEIARKSVGAAGGSTSSVLVVHDTAARSGAELALLSSPSVRQSITDTLQELTGLLFVNAKSDEWPEQRDAFLKTAHKTRTALYAELGVRPARWRRTKKSA